MLDWLARTTNTTARLLGLGSAEPPPADAAGDPAGSALQLFATMFHDGPLPLLLTTEQSGRIVAANAAAQALAGRSAADLCRGTVFDLGGYRDSAERATHLEAVNHGSGPAVREFRVRTPAGQDLRLLAHTSRVIIDDQPHMLTALTNVSAIGHMDERLLYAQRMEVIGRLSGGVAHQFNNLLTVMQGHLDALAGELPPSLPLIRRVDVLRRSVADAAQITSGLLTFAGRNPVPATLVDVNAVLDDLAPVLTGVLGEDIRVEWDPSRSPVPVLLGREQLGQLVVNLALNARDAMPDGGRLTVVTRRVDLSDTAALPGPGSWVVITLADNGHGMNDDVRRHMFEPFFTTKTPGQATGLGLSICLGIVEQAGGHIVANSSPGHGTAIDLYLPWAGANALPAVQVRSVLQTPANRPAILLVEDEPDVREIVAEILRRAGHTVHAFDGLAAVQAFLGRGYPPVELLLTDIVLPGGSGLDVATLVRAHYPGVPVLFMSGYSEPVFSGGQPVEHLLPKPFTAKTLLATVDDLVASRAAAAAS